MRALKFDQAGSLDDLHMEEVPLPTPAAGEVLVEIKAAAINPSDIKNVQGEMHETTVPRIPGRDFAGMIMKGPDQLLGQSVFGSGGNLGFGRDGSHAEYLTIPATAVLPLPREAGTFPSPAVETFPLEEGLRLYRDIAESRSKTKPILVP
jgi:NADPH2:quinone reductase